MENKEFEEWKEIETKILFNCMPINPFTTNTVDYIKNVMSVAERAYKAGQQSERDKHRWRLLLKEKPELRKLVNVMFESGLQTSAYYDEDTLNGLEHNDICYIPIFYWRDYNCKRIDESEGKIIKWQPLPEK